jgi:cyclopropane-fatty-acyl-phospholipid synthase
VIDAAVADARLAFRHEGREYVAGREPRSPAGEPCDVTVQVHNPRVFGRALGEGNLGLGEAYRDGDYDVVQGSLEDLLGILLRNRIDEKIGRDFKLALRVGLAGLRNRLRGRHDNVREHYELGNEFFANFLGKAMAYTCGYLVDPGDEDDLDRQQFNKFDRICRKLELQPGQTLLDLGCGWGGFLIHAATHYGVTGTGYTVSPSQVEWGRAAVEKAGLTGKVRIELDDYGAATGQYDRVSTIGMMEHMPLPDFPRVFGTLAARLKPGGLGLIHCITCAVADNGPDGFTQKYILPGSRQPKLSEMAAAMEERELLILDVENIKTHYVATSKAWLEGFRRGRAGLPRERYPEPFLRLWDYNLSCWVAATRYSAGGLLHILFTNDRTRPTRLARV